MLIKCPECGNMVSDKATCCMKCGYPVDLMNNNATICKINGVDYDLSKEISLVHSGDKMLAIKELRQKCNISLKDAANIMDLIKYSELPKEYNCSEQKIYTKQVESIKPKCENVTAAPKCPTCGSTNLKRLNPLFQGWVPKQFRCNNCLYEW